MKPGKHAQSFVLHLYTMNELRKKRFHWLGLQSAQKTTIVFCARSKQRKRTKTYNKDICGVSKPFSSINYVETSQNVSFC